MAENVLVGKEGEIEIDGEIFNNVIRNLRVTETIGTNKRFVVTSRKPAETVQSNQDIAGVMECALTPGQGVLLWNLRRRVVPFDIRATMTNSAGDTVDVEILSCTGEGDSELPLSADVEDGIHFEFPFQARELELIV